MEEKFRKNEESMYTYNVESKEECLASTDMKDDFNENGFIIVKNLFSENEIGKIVNGIDGSDLFEGNKYGITDKSDRAYFVINWLEVGDDVLGISIRTQKCVGIAEELLDRGELYMYDGACILKQAHTGGALIWHQDYGYWYKNRCIFPDMMSVFIALTKNDHENGGLKVIKGSHKCGRLEHGLQAGQQGADEERVEMIKQVLPVVECNLTPGDAVFFHANTLHSSETNDSEFKRWCLLFALNTKHNSPDRLHYNSQYNDSSKIVKVQEDALEKMEDVRIQARKYFDPTENKNIKVKPEHRPKKK